MLVASLKAQSSDGSESEEMITLSPFEVSREGESSYAAQNTLSGARISTPLIDPRTAALQPAAAVSIFKRADAVAVQFVLSHSGDKQETRNQELYASVERIQTAMDKVPGTRVEQREVRFTGGDRKFFSVSKGGSTTSFVSILVLADLPIGTRVADRVKQVRDVLGATKLVGQTKYSDGSVGLYLKNPDQYRREILQKIFEDVDFMKKGFNGEMEIQPSGLAGKVRMRVAAEAEIELWIDYGFAFRSIRELEATKKK
jgi:hypothetical protein